MRICVVGTGVIGTIYGLALSEAGHDVVHLVRPGRAERLREGVSVNLLDARGEEPVERGVKYRPKLVPSDVARAVSRSAKRGRRKLG